MPITAFVMLLCYNPNHNAIPYPNYMPLHYVILRQLEMYNYAISSYTIGDLKFTLAVKCNGSVVCT